MRGPRDGGTKDAVWGVTVATRKTHEVEADIDSVERQLFALKDEISNWSDAAADIATSAAIERARNAEMGRGLGGALFGAKYRAAARRAAASNNAAIARQVADKRAAINRAKQDLRLRERGLRARLRDLKAELRDCRAFERQQAAAAARVRPVPAHTPIAAPPSGGAVDVKKELQRLKALHVQGRLDAVGYEQARIALLQPHLRT